MSFCRSGFLSTLKDPPYVRSFALGQLCGKTDESLDVIGKFLAKVRAESLLLLHNREHNGHRALLCSLFSKISRLEWVYRIYPDSWMLAGCDVHDRPSSTCRLEQEVWKLYTCLDYIARLSLFFF